MFTACRLIDIVPDELSDEGLYHWLQPRGGTWSHQNVEAEPFESWRLEFYMLVTVVATELRIVACRLGNETLGSPTFG